MTLAHQRTLEFLRAQTAHVDDLRFDWLVTVDDIWAECGLDAASCFLLGA